MPRAKLYITDLPLAMARSHCNKLPSEEVWLEQAHHDYRSEEAMPRADNAARRDMERGR